MSNLVFDAKWNSTINQVEAGEEIRGGIDGTANIATKQLAENIFYLKDNLYQLVGYVPPDLTDEVRDIVETTKDRFDDVIDKIIKQSEAILAESKDRIEAVSAANDALRAERDARIAKYDLINAQLNAESAARIQSILDEQLQRKESIINSAIAQEVLLATESKAIRDSLVTEAAQLNATISALGSRVSVEIDGLTQTITQTSESITTSVDANARILDALKVEYENNKASVLSLYTAMANEQEAQAEILTNLRSTVNENKSEVTEFKKTTATKDLATATSITNLKAIVDGNASSFSEQIETLVSADEAQTSQLTSINSTIAGLDTVTADLIQKNSTVTTLASSTAESLRLLQAAFGSNNASFNTRITANADKLTATATKLENLESTTGTNLASIREKQETLTTADASFATQLGTLTTEFEDTTAQLTEQITSAATANTAAVQKTDNLRAQLIGGYDGNDLDKVSEGLLHQERLARVSDVESLVQQVGLLSAGVGEQFDPKEIWHFSSEPEGWINGVFQEGYLKVTNETVTSPTFEFSGVTYRYLKMRIVRVGAPVWEGKFSYNTKLPKPIDITLPEPAFVDDVAVLDADLDWTGQIKDIQLKLGKSGNANNYYLIDWIAIGRPSPGASSAALLDVKTASASRDEALSQSIQQLNSELNTKTALLTSTINTKTATLTTQQQTQATNILTLDSKVDNIDLKLSANISRNDSTITTKHNALAESVNTLRTNTQNADALFTSQLTVLTDKDSAKSQQLESLTATLEKAKSDIITTNTATAAADKVLADNIGSLSAKLGKDTALINTQITALVNKDAAFATDFNSLSVKFDNLDDEVAQNTVDIVAETKARADAVSAQATRVNTLDATVGANHAYAIDKVNILTNADATITDSLNILRGTFNSNATLYTTKFKALTDADTAQASLFTALRSEFNTNKSTVGTELTTITNNARSLASEVSQLSVNFNNSAAAYTTQFQALATADRTIVDSIASLSASFEVLEDGFGDLDVIARKNTADIKTESTTRVNALKAQAQTISELNAQVDGNLAEVNRKISANSTSISAAASSLEQLNTEVAGNKATIKNNYDTQVALNRVSAENIETVSAQIEGGYSDKTRYADKNKSIQWTRTTSIAEALFNANERTIDLDSRFENSVARFSETITTLTDSDKALAERTSQLAADFSVETGVIRDNLTTASGKITNLERAVVDANGSIVSAESRITGAYNSAILQVTENVNEYTRLKVNDSTESAKAYTDSIQIGGRNLLIGSKVPNFYNSDTGFGGGTRIHTEEFGVITAPQGFNTYGIGSGKLAEAITSGTEYVLTTEVMSNSLGTFNTYFYAGSSPYLTTSIIEINKWQTVEYKFTQNVSLEKGTTFLIGYDVRGFIPSSNGVEFKWKNWKLEKGNKATVWTPAPEDITTYVDSEIVKVTTKVNSKADISRVDTVENNATRALAQAETKITGEYNTAINTTKSNLETFANTKANNALGLAREYTNSEVVKINEVVNSKADIKTVTKVNNDAVSALAEMKTTISGEYTTAINQASTASSTDATTKANAALASAKADAKTKADKALSDALSDTAIKSDAARDAAKVFAAAEAKAKADAAIATASGDATSKANAAKSAAEATAAADAKSKADKALADAKIDATNKANAAQLAANSYTDGKVAIINTTISSKADISRVDTVENNATKALASAKTELTGSYTSAISTSNTANQTYAETKADEAKMAAEAASKLYTDSIEIGGRNLLLSSKVPNLTGSDTGLNGGTRTQGDDYGLVTSPKGFNIYGLSTGVTSEDMTPGTQYMLSNEIMCNTTGSVIVYFRAGSTSDTRITIQEVNSQWQTIHIGFTQNNIRKSGARFLIGYDTRGLVVPEGGIEFKWRNWKLEKGNKATDWSPAPEDVTGYIDSEVVKVVAKVDSKADIRRVDTVENNAAQALASAKTELTGNYTTTISTTKTNLESYARDQSNTALNSAKLDSTIKANNAKSEANNYTDGKVAVINTSISSKADITALNTVKNDAASALAQSKTELTTRYTQAIENTSVSGLFRISDCTAGYESNGSITSSSPNHQTMQSLVPISGSVPLVIEQKNPLRLSTAGTNRIAFFNLNKEYISSSTLMTLSGVEFKEIIIQVPILSRFMRIGVMIGDDGNFNNVTYTIKEESSSDRESKKNKLLLESKADISRVDTIESTAAQSVAQSKVDLTAGYTTAIRDIEIGGRNLLLNSKTFNVWSGSDRGGGITLVKEDDYTSFLCTVNGSNRWSFDTPITNELISGNEYAISVEYKSDTSFSFLYRPYGNYDFSVPASTGGGWNTITRVFKNTTGSDISKHIFTGIADVNINSNLKIRSVKIEKGNKATDWTPAPEDISIPLKATITKLDIVEATANGVKAESNVLSTVGGKIAGWKSLNTGATSSFDILSDNFTVGNSTFSKRPFNILGNDIVFNGKVSFNSITDTAALTNSITAAKTEAINWHKVKDTRHTNETPSWYQSNYPFDSVREFKIAYNINISSNGYCFLETLIKYGDASGGGINQTAYLEDGRIFSRRGSYNTWDGWVESESAAGSQQKVDVVKNNIYFPNTTEINGGRIRTNTITAEQINVSNLSAISVNIGHFKSSETGARLEIKDSLLSVYDSNNQLRVRLGLW